MEEKLRELINEYEKEIEKIKNTNYYEDSNMYFGRQEALDDVVRDLKKLLEV